MKTLVFAFFMIPFFSFSNGELIGNGGGFLPAQIVREGYRLHSLFETGNMKHIEELKSLRAEEFLKAIQKTRIVPVEGPIIDNQGFEVDARFYTNEKNIDVIEVNKNIWLKYLTLKHEFSVLVFHEYLRVLASNNIRYNDDQYRISKQLKKNQNTDKSLYYDLQKSFSNGSKITFSEIQGSYSGRCLSKHDTISLSASALVVEEIGSKKIIIEGIPEVDHAEETYFDDFTSKQIINYIYHLAYDFSTPYTFAGDLASDYIGAYSRMRFRVSKGTIIAVYSSLRSQIIDFSWGSIEVKKDEDWAYCYYLKRK